MGKLFGTDGIRGIANQYPITPEIALRLGRALVVFLKQNINHNKKLKVVIGRDTRISGHMIEGALIAGISSMGCDIYLADIIPTPGIAYLTLNIAADAGIVISASHNPFYDNGIKIFQHNGYKLSDKQEDIIEKLICNDNLITQTKSIKETGVVYSLKNAAEKYISFLKTTISVKDFHNFKIIMDCANGATFQIAPKILKELGADVKNLYIDPDGKNINHNCGSQFPENIVNKICNKNADIGFAFDGDGDRLIAIDEKGNIITGDQILAIYANFAKQNNQLPNNIVISTVMSNIGLCIALKQMNIHYIMSNVGDRYVLQDMIKNGAVVGGEDSGHMIFLQHHTSGDGILTALKLLEIMQKTQKPLSELAQIMQKFPQVLMNVNVRHKPPIKNIPQIMSKIKDVENKLNEKGRVLVRYSGTQPICRVMIEGPSVDEIEKLCLELVNTIQESIG